VMAPLYMAARCMLAWMISWVRLLVYVIQQSACGRRILPVMNEKPSGSGSPASGSNFS